MNILKRLISNINSKRYSTSNLKERYLLKDYKYLKIAYAKASNHLKIQAVEYLAHFKTQENLDYLIKEFKHIENDNLKSYTYQSILKIKKDTKLTLADSDKIMLQKNKHLVKNIGTATFKSSNNRSSDPITFRDKNKDYLKELNDKKRLNENMTGF